MYIMLCSVKCTVFAVLNACTYLCIIVCDPHSFATTTCTRLVSREEEDMTRKEGRGVGEKQGQKLK